MGTLEWWTPNTVTELHFKGCISQSSQFYCLLAQIFSSQKWLRYLFYNEDSNISLMIFQSQPHIEHTLGEKITVMQNNFTFLETNVFSLNVWLYLHISKINSFADLKQDKRLLDSKSWEPLDATVRWMHEWLCQWNICTTVELVSWRMKNKTEDYINTCNGRPFHEEKKILYDPFLWMGFNCLKAAELLWRDPGVPVTHLMTS